MIHALPGMGADRRMFPAPWGQLPEFVAHDWPEHRGEITLPGVARTVCDKFGIQDGDVLVGASLGGMVSCEIAKLRKLKQLYLVGSATSKDEVNRLLAFLHPLADFAPIEWLQFSAGQIPVEEIRMFAGADTAFVRKMCAAIFKWEGLGTLPVPCYRLHGRFDLVILPPEQPHLLVDGGHLISMTHATECVEFIKNRLQARPI